MLRITTEAAKVVSDTRAASGVPDSYGLRVSGQPGPQGAQLGFGFAESPVEGDEVSEQEGVRLFVAPEVAEPLSDSVIDVTENEDARLVLRRGAQQ